MRNLLGELGFHEVWLAQSIGDSQQFISLFKQRLNDNFMQNWNARLNASSRALLYRNFNTFCFKPNLAIVKIESARQLKTLTRLRTSSHRLEIEAGRWAKPVSIHVDQRLCTTCYILEDEFHFILECSRYNDLRTAHTKRYFR